MTDDTAVASVESAMDMSGLLFQTDPDIDGWQVTRAVSPEIVAFTPTDGTGRLSVNYYREGETEQGSEYVYETDTYDLELHAPNNVYRREAAHDRETAAEKAVELMAQYNNE